MHNERTGGLAHAAAGSHESAPCRGPSTPRAAGASVLLPSRRDDSASRCVFPSPCLAGSCHLWGTREAGRCSSSGRALGLTTGGAPGGQRAAAGATACAGHRQRERVPGCREDPGRSHVIPKKSSRGARVRHALGPSDAARSFKGQHPSFAVASPAPQFRRDADVGVTQPALATGGTLFPRQRVRLFSRRNGSPSRVSVRRRPRLSARPRWPPQPRVPAGEPGGGVLQRDVGLCSACTSVGRKEDKINIAWGYSGTCYYYYY